MYIMSEFLFYLGCVERLCIPNAVIHVCLFHFVYSESAIFKRQYIISVVVKLSTIKSELNVQTKPVHFSLKGLQIHVLTVELCFALCNDLDNFKI
jgi:hypothetical protein